MEIYEEIEVNKKTLDLLDYFMEKFKFKEHNTVIEFALVIYFIKKSIGNI